MKGCLERKSVSPKTQENRGRLMPDCKKTILSLPQVTEETGTLVLQLLSWFDTVPAIALEMLRSGGAPEGPIWFADLSCGS